MCTGNFGIQLSVSLFPAAAFEPRASTAGAKAAAAPTVLTADSTAAV